MPHHDPSALRELLGSDAVLCRRAITGDAGVALPPLVDHHVHLHLIEERALGVHGIAAVVDLGGDPVVLAQRLREGMPHVAYAGAFLTAPGGYPAGRSWAPPGVVREVSDPSLHPGVAGGAATAVDEQASFGASVIKVALNASAGAVPDAETLTAIVSAARAHGLAVVAHTEGAGMARRAIEAGADALAHVPFTERCDDALISAAAAAGQRWISTLDIHRDDTDALDIASANLAAFVRAGGIVLYGTDLGNGDLPVGVNARELAALHGAGLRGAALVEALVDPWPLPDRTHGVSTFVPGDPPADLDAVPAWLARATVVPTEELIPDDHS
ncbi:MAG: amidohydrolase family protein [Microbacterium sp.]